MPVSGVEMDEILKPIDISIIYSDDNFAYKSGVRELVSEIKRRTIPGRRNRKDARKNT
jgi:hypothetical protein